MKLLPNDIEAEKGIIASCVLFPESAEEFVEALEPKMFYSKRHQNIFSGIKNLILDNQPITLVTLAEELRRNKILKDSGGALYLSTILNEPPVVSGTKSYSDIIINHYIKREFLLKSSEIQDKCFDSSTTAEEVIDLAQNLIMAVDTKDASYSHVSSSINESLRRLEQIQEHGGVTGLETGISAIDELTAGLQKSDLIILAARPSMGKSALALNIAENIANRGNGVVFFSLEMPEVQLCNRMISRRTKINGERFKWGGFKDVEWNKIKRASKEISEIPMFINATPNISYMQIRKEVRKLKKEQDIKLVVVDYLQLMQGDRSSNRVNEIGSISKNLKHIAKEFDIPVLALSQLNRGLEARQNKRPVLSDLRESGDIEQDADIVAFIYRDEVYNHGAEEGETELIFSKYRNGATGIIPLHWNKKITEFTDVGNSF